MKKAVLVNYNHDPKDWWLEYGYKPEDVTIYDRSDDGVERTFAANVIRTENVGNVDYDKLCYLVDNYDNLPETFLWGKTNLWKYITKEEFAKVADNKEFTPLLTQNHKTYSDNNGPVNFYSGGMYYERNPLVYHIIPNGAKYFNSYPEWAKAFGFENKIYVPFPPGGNFILTKERVHMYSRDIYAKMASYLPYCTEPLEAHLCERSYFNMWKI